MFRLPLSPWILWLESLCLIALAWTGHALWLLPLGGLLSLFAALGSRGIMIALPASAGCAIFWWLHFPGSSPVLPPASHAVIPLVMGAACAFFSIITSLGLPNGHDPVRRSLSRFCVMLHFIAGGALLAAGYLQMPTHLWLAHAAAGLCCILAVDTVFKLLGRLYTPKRHWDTLAVPGAFFFYRWLGKPWSECLPAQMEEDESFSLRLPEMWMWPSIRAAALPLAGASLLLAWAASGIHQIENGQVGMRHQLGTWGKQPLTAGIHVSLPWPLGGIQNIDTGKIHETVLGFRADPGRPILWERAHYEGETLSLVGGGDDFLSISVPVFYRIENPAAYLLGSTESETLLRDLAGRLLLRQTLNRSAREIMTTAREEMRASFHTDLQAELDRSRSGLRVMEVYFRDIHPPVAVAPSFQEVVGAMEEKEAALHDGESYRRDVSTRARGDSLALLVTAEAAAQNRLEKARGEAARFTLQSGAYAQAPELYKLREGFRVFDETLSGAKKIIMDEKLRSSIPTTLDLRKVLNPDLIDMAPPTPEMLVPRASKSRDAFDLDIDGFLRTDRGEIPAVSTTPEDSDNLLNTEKK